MKCDIFFYKLNIYNIYNNIRIIFNIHIIIIIYVCVYIILNLYVIVVLKIYDNFTDIDMI